MLSLLFKPKRRKAVLALMKAAKAAGMSVEEYTKTLTPEQLAAFLPPDKTEPKVTANVRSADDHHCDGDHDGNRDTHDTDSDAASAHTLAQRTSSDGAQHDSWHRDGDRHRDGRRSGRR